MQSASERECMHIAPLSVQNLKDPLGVTISGMEESVKKLRFKGSYQGGFKTFVINVRSADQCKNYYDQVTSVLLQHPELIDHIYNYEDFFLNLKTFVDIPRTFRPPIILKLRSLYGTKVTPHHVGILHTVIHDKNKLIRIYPKIKLKAKSRVSSSQHKVENEIKPFKIKFSINSKTTDIDQ
jgi:hypothetical protein